MQRAQLIIRCCLKYYYSNKTYEKHLTALQLKIFHPMPLAIPPCILLEAQMSRHTHSLTATVRQVWCGIYIPRGPKQTLY